MSPIFGSATVQTRTGRPIFVGPNKKAARFGGINAQEITSYRGLYDPDRIQNPKRIAIKKDEVLSWDISWANLDKAIIKTLNGLGKSAKIALLTKTAPGLSQDHLIETIQKAVPNFKRYVYEPLCYNTLRDVTNAAYGSTFLPVYRFDKAHTIVSFGCDFIGTWLTSEEYSAQFVDGRNPEDLDNFNRLHVFEGGMTLTGMNADERYRVLPSNLPFVALAVAYGVLNKTGKGGSIPATFAPAAVAKVVGLDPKILDSVIDELVADKGRSLVVGGGLDSESPDGRALEAAVILINEALGNVGKTVLLDRAISHNRGGYSDVEKLINEINSGNVDVLIIDKSNPVYALPQNAKLVEALKKVGLVVSTSDRIDETAKYAHYLATGSHSFESWGDAMSYDGICSVKQAIIQPMYQTRSLEESLLLWFGQSLVADDLGGYLNIPKLPTDNRGGNVPTDAGPYYRFVRDFWKNTIYPKAKALASFDRFWADTLRQGFIELPPTETFRTATFNQGGLAKFIPASLPAEHPYNKDLNSKEIRLFASGPIGDGTQANNGQLQELPDPVTKTVWTSYVMVSPKTFRDNKLKMGQYLEVTVNGVAKRFPVCFQPGLHDDVLAIPVGYGRTAVGDVGNGIGENAFEFTKLADGNQYFAAIKPEAVKILPHAEKLCQIHGGAVLDLERRNIMSIASLDEYRKSKSAGIEKHPPLGTFWKRYEYEAKWGMSIDLNKCTNCGACVIACQEENNIPVVGPQGIRENREMHWLRMDRYYLLPDEAKHLESNPITDPMHEYYPEIGFGEFMESPRVVWQPMMCQQCERAPCENVCPVGATSHSEDGLNMMVYNRCVGTRYCANNCPYKVRRFNWFSYSTDRSDSLIAKFFYPELKLYARLNVKEPMGKGLNPDVTVRSRGVMEKCTFCVHRIRRAKWANMKRGLKGFDYNELNCACEDVCSTGAIVFGNLVDESTEVAKLHKSPRALSCLAELGVMSSVAYLTRLVNSKHVFNHEESHEPGHLGEDEDADHHEGQAHTH